MTDLDLANWLDSQAHHDDEFAQRLRDAASRLRTRAEVVAVAAAYEEWEADLILCNEAWRGSLPRLTPALFDRLLEIQILRNAALQKARGEL